MSGRQQNTETEVTQPQTQYQDKASRNKSKVLSSLAENQHLNRELLQQIFDSLSAHGDSLSEGLANIALSRGVEPSDLRINDSISAL